MVASVCLEKKKALFCDGNTVTFNANISEDVAIWYTKIPQSPGMKHQDQFV